MPFPDCHALNEAFLANRLERLAELIVMQGQVLLGEAGLEMPSRTVSLLLLVGERKQLSVADAVAVLCQPHQLVTQRAELLIGLGLVDRNDDPADGRRKILTLSVRGEDQYVRLQARLLEAAGAFAALSEEVGCDLLAMVEKAHSALERTSLLERIECEAPTSALSPT